VTIDRTPLRSIEELTDAARHVTALLAAGVLTPHERAHLIEARDRIADTVTRKTQEDPRPLRGPAHVPTA
jgi:hypothetical protein